MAWTPFTRLDHDRSGQRYTSDMTDREFALISPIFYVLQNGRPWANAQGAAGYDAGKKIKGRKRHILTDTVGLLLKCDVHSASIQDRDGAARLSDRLTARFPFLETIVGDGGYAGERVRSAAPRPVQIVRRSDKAKGFQVLPV